MKSNYFLILFLFALCNSSYSQNRTMAEELSFITSKANSLTQNSLGYWEADFGNGIVLIYIPQGSFTMGNNMLSSIVVTSGYASAPEHTVNLSHYWISKNPITIGQFRTFVQATNYVTDVERAGSQGCYVYDTTQEAFVPKTGRKWDNAYQDILAAFPAITINDNHPVACVSWNDAIAYTNWLRQQKQVQFTIPTEAEYEYACRGTDGRIYPWGNNVSDGTRANYADETMNTYFPNLNQALVHTGVTDGFAITSPVGSFPNGASPIGALDMVGNVNQWVYDAEYDYTSASQTNPIHLTDNGVRMQKAGDWSSSAGRTGQTPDELAEGHNIRAEGRSGDVPNSADDHLGFRIAISYVQRLESLLSLHDTALHASKITLHQNPVKNDKLILNNAIFDSSYEIYNLNGQLLKAGDIGTGNILLSHIGSGLYFIKITSKSGKSNTHLKFIIE
ncbi:MAG: SUMF1/EgtB/PvdO family nonheme iron enzyme [Flavobacteriaceae bacterium]|nr:MAG: SUMF1/EgtB/PvdO family nonheme iron enzyme [Flavobacteriaceae bacterium]